MQLFQNIIVICQHMLIVNLISSQLLSFPFPSISPSHSPSILANNSQTSCLFCECHTAVKCHRTGHCTAMTAHCICNCSLVGFSILLYVHLYLYLYLYLCMRAYLLPNAPTTVCVAKTSKNCAKQLILFQTSS